VVDRDSPDDGQPENTELLDKAEPLEDAVQVGVVDVLGLILSFAVAIALFVALGFLVGGGGAVGLAMAMRRSDPGASPDLGNGHDHRSMRAISVPWAVIPRG